jgi:hypothetical protein
MSCEVEWVPGNADEYGQCIPVYAKKRSTYDLISKNYSELQYISKFNCRLHIFMACTTVNFYIQKIFRLLYIKTRMFPSGNAHVYINVAMWECCSYKY